MSLTHNVRAPLPLLSCGFVVSCIVLATLISGCSSMGMHGGRWGAQQQSAMPAAGEFAWSRQVVEAAGTAHLPMNLAGSQRELYARQSAKTTAIANLKSGIAKLVVYENVTVDAVMRQNLAVRRSIEGYLQHAEVVSMGEIRPGDYEVRVRARLQPVADILGQNQYAPDYLPPAPPPLETDVPPVS